MSKVHGIVSFKRHPVPGETKQIYTVCHHHYISLELLELMYCSIFSYQRQKRLKGSGRLFLTQFSYILCIAHTCIFNPRISYKTSASARLGWRFCYMFCIDTHAL